MDEKRVCPIRTQLRSKGAVLRKVLILYLEDLLLFSGGVCFVSAAWEWRGLAPALAVAGVWLCLLAVIVARAKRGGDR